MRYMRTVLVRESRFRMPETTDDSSLESSAFISTPDDADFLPFCRGTSAVFEVFTDEDSVCSTERLCRPLSSDDDRLRLHCSGDWRRSDNLLRRFDEERERTSGAEYVGVNWSLNIVTDSD